MKFAAQMILIIFNLGDYKFFSLKATLSMKINRSEKIFYKVDAFEIFHRSDFL